MTIPIHIITGFLGSGKTTLMNRILHNLPEGHRPAMVVNDFGKVLIDGELIERGDYAVKELPSGCVCCTLRGPLANALEAIIDEQDPDSVLLETTGIAEPAQLPSVFAGENIADVVHTGNIICVVDSSRFASYESHFTIVPTQVRQANTVVINKLDVAASTDAAATRARIDYLSQPGAVVFEAEYCEIDMNLIQQERPVYFDVTHSLAGSPGHDLHSRSVETRDVYRLDLLTAFMQEIASRIVRGKGIVRTDEGPRLIQLSASGLEINEWPDELETSRLVVIGAEIGSIDLQGRLDAIRCIE